MGSTIVKEGVERARLGRGLTLVLAGALCAATLGAQDWTHWRGPHEDGDSPEKGLISTWSKDGENLIWRDDFTGRSTPIVFDGRACAIGRAGEEILRQEAIACWDAGTGKKLWERRFDVVQTTVPWNRVGWASMAGDSETGNLFAQGVDGRFVALDRDGKTAWEWQLGQDVGRFSGYGGRTNTPLVDGDLVIAHVINAGWGKDFGPGGDRYFAFDKRSGEIQWVTQRGAKLQDLNTCAAPVTAKIGDQRLLIGAGADGWIRAFQVATGKEVWSFHLTKRGLNSAPIVVGDTVYAGHSEENVDNDVMGRFVAIDATGSGDVTTTHEKWRIDALANGFAGPLYHDGMVYVVDNSANMFALDAATGAEKWTFSLGTVGKAAPVYADGKIYATEVNGNFHILEPGADGAKELDSEHIEMPGSHRHAEIYASPAVAYGRVYFVTEEGIYCLGDKSKPFSVAKTEKVTQMKETAPADAKPAWLQVVPAVAVAKADDTLAFRAKLYDEKGRFLRETAAEWKVMGLPGTFDESGKLSFDASKVHGTLGGAVAATAEGLSGSAAVRVAGDLPWVEDFSGVEPGRWPSGWMGVARKGGVQEVDGNKMLVLEKPHGGVPRARPNLGPSFLSGYTIQADVMGTQAGRVRTDVGLTNSGYTFDMQGNHQRLQIRSWDAALRMMKQMDFAWDNNVWYTMKLRVDYPGDKAVIRGKVWKRDEAEPEEWTFTAEDPLPIRHGNPGLYAYIPSNVYFDNVKVEVSK